MELVPVTPSSDTQPRGAERLADLIRARRDEIVSAWEARVRTLGRIGELPTEDLVDHIPDLLDEIAKMTEALARSDHAALPQTNAQRHAIHRLEGGFDLAQVITEYGFLRQAILERWHETAAIPGTLGDLQVLDGAMDTAIAASVEHYMAVRDRTVQAFDRIASVAVESTNLDELLQRLLGVLRETTPTIDTAAIALRDGDVLRVRAAVGLGRESEEGATFELDEGFAGTVAARAEPMTLQEPSLADSKSPRLASAAIRVLHGVPLIEGARVIGVATIGSVHAWRFSDQDERMFATMVSRATVAIHQQMLREEARRVTEQLVERDRELRALAENIPQLAWMTDATGAALWLNQRWFDYTGMTAGESRGWGWLRAHDPQHVRRVLDGWRTAVATGEVWEDTYPIRGRDGLYRWFLSRAVPIRDAAGHIERWFGTNTDVTANRFLDRATEILASSLALDATLDALAHLVVPDLADSCIVDLLQDGHVRHAAVARGESAGSSAPDAVTDDGARRVLETGRPHVIENLDDRPELRGLGLGSWIGAPIIARGTTIGVIHVITTDPSRRYRASSVSLFAELGRRAGIAVDNARLYAQAQDAVRVREDVLAIVSHDLRNPLGAIELGANLLQQKCSDAHTRKPLDAITRAVDRMQHLITDLLDMANISAGRFSVSRQQVEIASLVGDVLDMHEPLAAERGIALARDLDLADVVVVCDRNRIAQVLDNLLGNAVKFCRRGDVVRVVGRHDARSVQLVVTDSGPGIAKTDVPHIFQPYWSGQRAKKKGTGLGLFISKAIVDAHGGSLTVHSDEGRGAAFTVALPVAQ